MEFGGLLKTTLLDVPSHVAATVFTIGCNYRCPFCHNASMVLGKEERIAEEEILAFLEKRRRVLEAICISGGEPTLQKDLADFCKKVKALGYFIKLDTNGSHPEVIKELYEAGLIDYVAMDVKAGRMHYAAACGFEEMCELLTVHKSIQMIMDCGIDYEFRTTLVKGLHTEEDIEDLGQMLSGAKRYYLQNYRDSESVWWKKKDFAAFSVKELERFADILREKIPAVSVRGEYD